QPQLYDVDGDGVLDILVPLYYLPGLAAVKYDGDSTLLQMWLTNTEGSGGSGSVMAKPVAGDINNDGQLDIFIASQDVSPLGGYDGTICRLDRLGNILYTTFTWRPCSGGLSLGDTDNDGVFELYQGDRDMDYSDGGYGKGVKSYWADNLTERGIRLDDITSSQAPVLADWNGDGIKDVITGMYRVQWILNSTNGAVLKFWSNNALSVHYGTTIYDIDGDGHLELLCNDGDHDNDAYTDVFDLVTGQMDKQLSMGPGINGVGGDWKWSPLVADIDPTHTGMEIVSCPNATGLDGGSAGNGAIMIWSSSYQSLQNVTRRPLTEGTYSTSRMNGQMGYPVVQDIDDDGSLELVTHSSGGQVYAFNTMATAPTGSNRIRSDVTFFGEDRLGVAQSSILPWAANYWTAPLVAPVSPGDNALAVPIATSQLSFRLREHQSQALTYSVTTSPNIGSTSGSIGSGSGAYNWNTRTVSLGPLAYDTTYRWTVTASDGSKTTTRTYTFRTQQDPNSDNNAPTQGTPVLVPSSGGTTATNFQCLNQSTEDIDGDPVTNIYRWTVNSEPVAQLLLPFDTRGEGTTADYSGFGNAGKVIGATWVPNGRVGGAYLFDGKDDAIVVSDGGLGYFDDKDYSSNNEELGGFGNWDAVTVEAWIYLTKFNNGSRIVAKIPSYALGFESGYTNRLYGAVWPYTGGIAQEANNASVDRMSSVRATVSISLNTWYHVAFTYKNGTGFRLYFNGALVGSSSSSGGPLSPSRGEPLYIGRLVQPFAGMIDDVRVYKYAVPAAQILNRYNESRNGLSSSSVFQPVVISAPYDTLGCDVIPTDSYDEGTTRSVLSGLGNSAPSVSDLRITPLRDRASRLDNEDLGV
ncbi:FG-GAP-like repeat-containing protein, partial [Candidatus Bathyarchaeota archaeon]|nr:FG-GAP-like repeat-containing protein [Candidatus Bathyarchaeota archaeon]